MELGVTGFEKAISNMQKLSTKLPDAVDKSLERLADEIVADAKRLAPVRSGELRDSIKIEDVKKGEVTIVASADHAGYVEFGNSRVHARPFIRPAIENKAVQMEPFIASELDGI